MSESLGFFIQNAAWIPALPLLSFVVVVLFVRPVAPKIGAWIATASILGAAILAYGVAWEYFHLPLTADGLRPTLIPASWEWLSFQARLTVRAGTLIDAISVLLLVVVTTVSALVHLYSTEYMHDDPGIGRYFSYLNLFTFSMLGLVLAPNIFQMYVFWELVGVSSFLLIGFYYQKPSAVAASKKAFIVTRFADLGFLVGILLLGYFGYQIHRELGLPPEGGVQALDFAFLTGTAFLEKIRALGVGFMGLSLLSWALLLVFMGAAGKSAMFPLHIWLPDAMEGPTPVSALIHAATMVVAGVYLVARMYKAFAFAGDVLIFVAYVGAFTSLFAAVIACTQDDIKRVLAFSTLSQLGYMMFALGVGSVAHPLGYTAAMFHLFTHAFFKALLFLGAGAVIHAVHTNDIWHMGGLRTKMPVTHLTFLIAVLAIAGIWPLAGFFSKDEILAAALEGGHPVIFAVGLGVAGLTAFYMARIYFVTFWGRARGHSCEHAHDPGLAMLVPLLILCVASIGAGWLPFGKGVFFGAHAHHGGVNWSVAFSGTLMAMLGLVASWFFYSGEDRSGGLAAKMGGLYKVIKHKFYIDELYLFITHRVIFEKISSPIAWFDRNVVDGAMNLTAWTTRTFGIVGSLLQTGQVQTYAAWLITGTIAAVYALWIFLR